MDKTVTITIEEYKCLRECLDQAIKILDSLGIDGSVTAPKSVSRETKAQKINKYKNLIGSGQRVKKPDYLKNK